MPRNRKKQREKKKKQKSEISKFNAEGYRDPTAYHALRNLEKKGYK